MRKKRLKHHADIFCAMFSGWRLANDMDSLNKLQSGIIEFDFLNKIQKLNGTESKTDFHMYYEIAIWFTEDLEKHNLKKELLKEAKLRAEFNIEVIQGKKRSKTKRIEKLHLVLNSIIITDKNIYTSEKTQTQEFHYVEQNK